MTSKRNTCDAEAARVCFRRASNKAKGRIRQCKQRDEAQVAEESKTNPKPFWAHVRGKLKTIEGVAPLSPNPKYKSSLKFRDAEKANILPQQFTSVFTHETTEDAPTMPSRTAVTMDTITVTAEMVLKEIRELNVNKSCGPDEIHPKMLKELADFISVPITILLNKTIQDGEIPDDWKKANVSAIFKKGAKGLAENYRPISLTSLVCKPDGNTR